MSNSLEVSAEKELVRTQEIKRLPDAEFEVMKVVWGNDPPITTSMIMKQLGQEKGWKIPTLSTLLQRLEERGFLDSRKEGKGRHYFPLITSETYLRFETDRFVRLYHGNSLASLVSSLYAGKVEEGEQEILLKWVSDHFKENDPKLKGD